MASYEGRLMKCGKCSTVTDRDVVAVLNLQMRGAGFPQRALYELIEGEELSRGNDHHSPLLKTLLDVRFSKSSIRVF
jgi:hypothetical protein